MEISVRRARTIDGRRSDARRNDSRRTALGDASDQPANHTLRPSHRPNRFRRQTFYDRDERALGFTQCPAWPIHAVRCRRGRGEKIATLIYSQLPLLQSFERAAVYSVLPINIGKPLSTEWI